MVITFQPSRCVNQIEDVCKDVEKTINQTIQNTLNKLEEDCEKISDLVDKELELDRYRLVPIAQLSLAGLSKSFDIPFSPGTCYQ